jgi:4-amino-4-deoxy-L-arabinose transferase-like glycosyltransferase
VEAPVSPRGRITRPRALGAAVIGIVFLLLYRITLAPDILGHDSGDWQAAGATLGISHSPGSPAYTILAWFFSHIPMGTLAARVNLLSAVMGAAGVVLVFIFMLMLLNRWLPALVSAATLGLGGHWWAHASVAQPYNSVPVIICGLLILLLLWREKGDLKLVWGGALLCGVGLAYHPSLLYFIPVLVAGLFVLGPWRKFIKPLPVLLAIILFGLGLCIYAYIPIRSGMNPVIRYTPVDSLSGLYHFVTVSEARSTGTFAATLPGQDELRQRLSEVIRQGYFPSYAFLVFGPAIALLYPAVWRRLKPQRRVLLFLAAGAFFHMTVVFIISGIYVQYYLPLLLYFSIWAGFSVWLVMTVAEEYLDVKRFRYAPTIATAVIYFGVLALGIPQVLPFVNHNEDLGMRNYANWVFSQAKPGAVVMANWDSYPGLLFAQKVDGLRPDLKIVPVPPETWRDYVPTERVENPTSQILLARSLPFDDRAGTSEIGSWYFISIKGRTYQDQTHGEPDPAAVQLFEVK